MVGTRSAAAVDSVSTTSVVEELKSLVVLGKASEFVLEGSQKIEFFTLNHPRTESSIVVGVNETGQLFELINVSDDLCTLLVNDYMIGATGTHILSPLSAVFFIIPQLITKAETRYVALTDLLDMLGLPQRSESEELTDTLKSLADSKGFQNDVVIRHNEEKMLAWLAGKVNSVHRVLDGQQEIPNDGNLRLACGIVCDYLSLSMKTKLEMFLKIPDLSQAEDGNSAKKFKSESSLDDSILLSGAKSAKVPEVKKSVTQKRLEKASMGTKSLSSFFKKP